MMLIDEITAPPLNGATPITLRVLFAAYSISENCMFSVSTTKQCQTAENIVHYSYNVDSDLVADSDLVPSSSTHT